MSNKIRYGKSEFAQSLSSSQQRAFIRFSRWLGREAVKADITPEAIELYSDSLKELSERTRSSYLSALRTICNPVRFQLVDSEFLQSLSRHQREAVLRFSRWLGRTATKEDINAKTIAEFSESEIVKSLSEKVLYSTVCSLRSIAKVRKLKVSSNSLAPIPTRGPAPTDGYDAGFDTSEEVNGEVTLRSFFSKQYKPKRLIGKSKNVLRLYATCFRKFSRWLGRPAVLSDLNDDTVAGYLYALSEVRSLHTVDREYCCLVALWRFAARKRLVDCFPEIAKPDGPTPIPDAWTQEELAKLMATAKEWDGEYGGVPAGLWWECLIRVIFDTGERVGAILQVKKDDIADNWLMVPATSRKGKKAGKRFKLSERTKSRLAELSSIQQSEHLFEWQLSYTYIWKVYGQILEEAGLPNNRRTKLHKIRRTVATYYEAAGGNATQLLGHSSRKVTEAYLDQRYIKTPQPCDLLDPL